MKMYRVNLLVSEREMLRILAERPNETFAIAFEGDNEAQAPAPAPVSTGAKRGRKPRQVAPEMDQAPALEHPGAAREAILAALESGPRNPIALSTALSESGVRRGMLAATLEGLLEEGDIVRRDNGDYALNEAPQEAAE